ncbi:beta-ketoacyl synthase N-terminal-like domain-containing protein [Streptomyces mobaraensis]|uniref:beta-ketoacyl synthase N-terminal-like domain-containing protein n=1 Tax=Streptomyces mobaraensis TaxID=35621 RepID=UPI0030B86DC2
MIQHVARHRDASAPDAVAVVGMACRFPGGIGTPGDLWKALCEGADLVSEVPPDRFDSGLFVDPRRKRPGRSCTSAGGFLHGIELFDAGYFGIAPREAARMDPQQRLLLETAVEALDDAGMPRDAWAGTDTGVFIGVSSRDFGELQTARPDTIDAYTMTGLASSVTANRISHFFDWHGESIAVDTACSSALTALHRACSHLRAGAGPAALAGGANVLLNPFGYAGFSAASMLSPTGRCRPFSAAADGFVRAEGAAVVVLRRLADALADGDPVHGVILATGANSDGRTRGLALPRREAQQALLESVYAGAGIDPDDLVYFEAHGTGTPAGDPVECEALGRALGSRRRTGALPIGSVKSNLGHLEAASGMAGLFKALLVLRHGSVPPTLHAEPLHPGIDFDRWGLRPTVRGERLADRDRPVVGVNSFGFGGANAHAVLAPHPEGAGARRALRLALADAGVSAGEVDHVNAHGTGTPPNDLVEGRVIEALLPHGPSVTATKGVLGHTLGAAGAVEAAVTVLTVQHGLVPPVANLERLDPALSLDAVRGGPRKQRVDVALSNSFGFGGHNTVLVFRTAG